MTTLITRPVFAVLASSWLFGSIGAGSDTQLTPLSAERFCELQGINLLGNDVITPEGFEGEVNLVSLGFVQKHQET